MSSIENVRTYMDMVNSEFVTEVGNMKSKLEVDPLVANIAMDSFFSKLLAIRIECNQIPDESPELITKIHELVKYKESILVGLLVKNNRSR